MNFSPAILPLNANDNTIAVLMSGGVDSSVSAYLLKQQGWNVVGITMQIPTCGLSGFSPCCGAGAALVCRKIGIQHLMAETSNHFREKIIKPFLTGYLEGETPSPCVDCNTYLKFGDLWESLENQFNIKHLATGHYAVVDDNKLKRAKDLSKDQSYFLYGIPLKRLPFLHFPLANISKQETREIAKKIGLSCANRPDSMEICFAPEGDYKKLFLDEEKKSGKIVDISGKVLGNHNGIHNFTIGQRRGLKISSKNPLYVLKIEPKTATIVVGEKEKLLSNTIFARNVNVLMPEKISSGCRFLGKIRSSGEPSECEVVFDGSLICAVFKKPVLSTSAGQHLVIYTQNKEVVLGGKITRNPDIDYI